MPKYEFATDPVADEDATIAGPNYRFTLIVDAVLRYEWAEDGIFEDRASTFAINRRFAHLLKPVIKETDDRLEVVTPNYHLSYDKKRFSPNGLVVDFRNDTTLWGVQWRYGAKPESNLGGTARTLDKVDGPCDVGLGILSRAGFSVIDDSDSMLFDGTGFVSPRRPGDRVDGYLFAYGRDFKAAMKAFFDISGHMPRLPRWSLGNWWSRFYKYTAQSYLELVDKFRENNIPLSVAVIDMDWHLVHEEGVQHAGWTGYTWNKKLFPDPEGFAASLHERGLKMTLNDHPHAGVASHEEQYNEVAAFLGHDVSGGKTPIPFEPTKPRFLDAYFDILHRSLENKGCDFWWIDWQQGSISNVPGLDPLWLLNHYQFLDQKQASGDNQAIIFSRYAGPGSHPYPVGFSGDTIVSWDSLRFQPEFTATASNIGYGWWSHDIGGHMHGSRDDELVVRWVQLGVLSPIMRLHSCDSPWGSKEPWQYRPDAERVITWFMRFRHRLIPYLYTLNANCALHDEPLVQPLYWRYPSREEAFAHPNQYFFGPSLVVAPTVEPADPRTRHAQVKVWIPSTAARYIDIFTGTVYDGDRELHMWRTLQRIPVLAPEGSIVPLDAADMPANRPGNPESFELLVTVGRDAQFTIVEDVQDDAGSNMGEDTCDRHIKVEWTQQSGWLTIDGASSRSWNIRFLGIRNAKVISQTKVLVNGIPADSAQICLSSNDELSPGILVRLPNDAFSRSDDKIAIQLGGNPQLDVIDCTGRFQALLLDFQMAFSLKDQLYAVLGAGKPTGVKVSEILSLGCDAAILGPLLELLLADSRN